jgi:acyl-CoA thioesterase I
MSRIFPSSLPGALSAVVLLILFSLACRGEVERADPGRPGGAAAEAVPVRRAPAPPDVPPRRLPVEASPLASEPAAPSQPAASGPLVVFLGDSLTAGPGLEEEQAFPAVVAERMAEQSLPIRVVNAGISGDTSAGGLRRLDWLLRQKPAVMVVGLGANDGLRGLPVEQTESNLREIVSRSQAAGARVLLLGMKIPPNYGDYAIQFEEIYPRVARDLGVPLVPFLLEGVGGVPDLNLPDGIHPNGEGQERVAENVVPYLRELVGQAG